ncbi:hypothetical protein APED_12660 [Acanthopleuribacter pedis]
MFAKSFILQAVFYRTNDGLPQCGGHQPFSCEPESHVSLRVYDG